MNASTNFWAMVSYGPSPKDRTVWGIGTCPETCRIDAAAWVPKYWDLDMIEVLECPDRIGYFHGPRWTAITPCSEALYHKVEREGSTARFEAGEDFVYAEEDENE